MARSLKHPELSPGNLAVRLPVVPTSAYGDSPVDGIIRYNAGNGKVEFFYNGSWNQIAKIGRVQIAVDTFIGDDSTQIFTMSQAESDPTAVAVFIGGVYQVPNDNYTVDGTTAITFSSPPPAPGINPNQIVVIHNLNSTNAV